MPSSAGSSVPRETFAKRESCRFSGFRHFGQAGIFVVLIVREKKLKTVLHFPQMNS